MLVIIPLLILAAYVLAGFLICRVLFHSNETWFYLSVVLLVAAPFLFEEHYKYQLALEYKPTCETVAAAPLGIDAASTIVVLKKDASDDLVSVARNDNLGSLGPDDKQRLSSEFLAVFREHYITGELELLSTRGVRDVLCDVDEDDNSCGKRVIAINPAINILTSKPRALRVVSSSSIRHWVWGSAIGSGRQLHQWTSFMKFRGSLRNGGWPFVWPWPGSTRILQCRSNGMKFGDWLTQPEVK